MPEITEKMLIQELRELEADGIVARTVHQTVPPRVDYSLTEQGERVQSRVCRAAGLGPCSTWGGPAAAAVANQKN